MATEQTEPINTYEAILDHVSKGEDPLGARKTLAVTLTGEQYTATHSYRVGIREVPGIGTGAAYASGDAFGTKFLLTVPVEGTIATAVFLDYDDEGLTKELVLFNEDFTVTADNSAFAVSDADLRNCVGVISIGTFYNFSANQLGIASPALYYHAPRGFLWGQVVTRGADNIAAGSIPDFFLEIV